MNLVGGIEIGIGNLPGWVFDPPAIKWWDALVSDGFYQVAAVGGSDDHKGCFNETDACVGYPTTMVLAANLSAAAIVAGVKAGRTVVKLHAPTDPMVTVDFADQPLPLDTNMRLLAPGTSSVTCRVTVHLSSADRGSAHGSHGTGAGLQVRLVANGVAQPWVDVSGSFQQWDTVFSVSPELPGDSVLRWRAEAYVNGGAATITSFIFARTATAVAASEW
jgi:hypothetical protein